MTSGICRTVPTLAAALLLGACALLPPSLPRHPVPERTVWLDQGWTPETRALYHHANQGTETFGIPYEWFVALEQPTLWPGEAPPLHDKAYLDRFGFIPGESVLPVGFAAADAYRDPTRGETWTNPATGQPLRGIGFTCAACHTGRMTYRGTELLIDGGSALIDLGRFRRAIGLSLAFTDLEPPRFNRFAARILGANAGEAARRALRARLDQVLADGRHELALINRTKADSVEEGFGRLDALNRIGNQVFAINMGVDANYAPLNAPVHYPRIWTAPWFTWVQYNASIMQPMVRNAGEALGVRALVNLTNPNRPQFDSTVHVEGLRWMEEMIAGDRPPLPARRFGGLRPPAWPETVLPPIDRARAERGGALYRELCQGCHLPPVGTAEFWRGPWWVQIDGRGERYLDLKQIPIARIGTDPEQAAGMARRTVALPPGMALRNTAFGPALGELVERVAQRWYDTRTPPVPARDRDAINGGRPNRLQAPLEYKARPLDGVWASPPYLHNGSVPSLYALLSPWEERPSRFTLGAREFDPVRVGYRDGAFEQGFALDTTLAGNRNTGHEFNAVKRPGVIGRGLAPEERLALIEYLKTL